MNNTSFTPSLSNLHELGEQIERDRSATMNELRQRDHDIGVQCDASDDVGRLLFWLNSIPDRVEPMNERQAGWLSEGSAANLSRLLAFVFGYMSVAGFLLASKPLINAFVFLFLFVFIQIVLCLISTFVMIKSLRGDAPVVFPLNLARFVISRSIPDMRYLRESQSVVRVLLLRYGQEFGAIFTMGAVVAAIIVPIPINFAFYWETSYSFINEHVPNFATMLAAPWTWIPWFSDVIVPAQIIKQSRNYPVLTDIVRAVNSSEGWLPFLIAAMLFYALLPRIILWALSKRLYSKLMRRSFVEYPGSESILLRMKSPMIITQALEPEDPAHVGHAGMQLDDRLMLLNWAGAIDLGDLNKFEEIRQVPPGNVLSAGLGTLEGDRICAQRINQQKPARLLVAVKVWEPPMADLRDFLDGLKEVTRCTLYLVPLPDRVVTDLHLQEWHDYSRELKFDAVDSQPLHRL